MATIITTSAGSTSNSYITTAEATTYFTNNPLFYTTWDIISDKDSWVLWSAKAIDRLSFSGQRYDVNQSMEFPRDITDEYTTAGIIPQVVKDAQCEMIIFLRMHTDNITMKPHQLLNSIDIDGGAIKTSYQQEDLSMKYSVIGGSMEAILNLLKFWVGGKYTAHLKRK